MLQLTTDIWSSLVDLFLNYGYLGVFLVSFLGSLIVFVPAPYFIAVVVLSLQNQYDPNLITISSAIGATLAKTIIFRASFEGQRIIDEQTRQRIKPFMKLVSRYGWSAAFVAAATPIPDDIVYIPLGFLKYDLKRFFLATLAGKIIITGIVAWGSRLLGTSVLGPVLEDFRNPVFVVLTISAIVALVAALLYIIARTNWEDVLQKWFPWTTEDKT